MAIEIEALTLLREGNRVAKQISADQTPGRLNSERTEAIG